MTARAAPATRNRGGRVVFAAAIGSGTGLTGMLFYALGVLINPLCDTFGWTRAEVSAAKTILTTSFIVTAPVIGQLVDRMGARRVALVSLPLFALAMLAMTQTGPSLESYYLLLLLLALAGCGTTPLVWTRAVATWFEARRGVALALTLIGPGVTAVFTPVLLDTLIRRYDWRAAFIAMAGFAALTLLPVALFFRENRDASGGRVIATRSEASPAVHLGATVAEALRTRRFWQLTFGFTLIGGVVSSLTVHLVPILVDTGLTRGGAVRVAGVMGLAVISGRLLTGFLVDRLQPALVAAVFVAMPIGGCLLLIHGPSSSAVAVAAVICVGLAAGSEVDLLPYLTARYFGLESYGRIYGLVFVAFYAGVGIGPLWLGHMFDVDGSYAEALRIVVPVLAIGAAAIGTLGGSAGSRAAAC